MMKHCKRIIALAVAAAMIFVIAGCGLFTRGPRGEPYPWVFVHGLNGYGDDSNIPIRYWGGLGGSLLQALEAEGFETHAPSVSPAGSAWDRAAELFAQLTGTQVDYGIAHSEANGIDRFGATFDTPLLEGWGEEDENGNLRRVNLIGHSFGGATIRMLAALLLNGSPAEQAAAAAAGEEVSPLFAGGKGDWIFSITTIAAPHNGVSLLSVLEINPGMAALARAMDQLQIDQIMDVLGIDIPGVRNFTQFLSAAEESNTAYADLSIPGARALNSLTAVAPGTYYFSFPVAGTDNRGRPTDDMALPARLLGQFIGSFTHPASGITDAWRANDGLVNTISSTRPFGEPSVTISDIDELDPQPGIWHVMPVVRGDHGSVIGLGRTLEQTLPLYLEHMRMVDGLR